MPKSNNNTMSYHHNQTQKFKPNYALVVPCYNEETRFPFKAFQHFASQNEDVILCFVNDGSKDQTLAVLRALQYECPKNVYVYDMKKNGGKAEAVRQGMLYMHRYFDTGLIGFLDADLATTPEEWLQMAKYKENYPQFGSIVGSRIQRLGANIQRDDNRSFFSSIIKKFIGIILKTPFQDTQCGAKIFQRNLVPILFGESFLSPWLFDVEIFLRLQKKFGKKALSKGVLEFPLMDWTEVGDSRIKFSHTIKIPLQLMSLHFKYNLKKLIKTPSGYSIFELKLNGQLMPAILPDSSLRADIN